MSLSSKLISQIIKHRWEILIQEILSFIKPPKWHHFFELVHFKLNLILVKFTSSCSDLGFMRFLKLKRWRRSRRESLLLRCMVSMTTLIFQRRRIDEVTRTIACLLSGARIFASYRSLLVALLHVCRCGIKSSSAPDVTVIEPVTVGS